MKIRDLISMLAELDPDMEVFVCDRGGNIKIMSHIDAELVRDERRAFHPESISCKLAKQRGSDVRPVIALMSEDPF